jgi:hypothetical protein
MNRLAIWTALNRYRCEGHGPVRFSAAGNEVSKRIKETISTEVLLLSL